MENLRIAMKSVISAQRMLISEMRKQNTSQGVIDYWKNEARERSLVLEKLEIKQRELEREEIGLIWGEEYKNKIYGRK